MAYTVNGVELDTDEQGYLRDANTGEGVAEAIAAAEGITLTPKHWEIIRYMREEFQENGHTPNFRNMLKGVNEFWPEADSKSLYNLFPLGPAKQAAKIAGLPQPLGKGGY